MQQTAVADGADLAAAANARHRRRSAVAQIDEHDACEHGDTVYESPENVPIAFCDRCSSIVIPETVNSVVARAVPLPNSLLRDERWSQLMQIYTEHLRVKRDVARMLREQETLLVRMNRWRDTYAQSGALVDYRAQHNPVYQTLDESIKRVANVLAGLQQTVDGVIAETRRKLLRDVQRTVPRRQEDFVRAAKRLIGSTRKTPLYHPNAGKTCTLCDTAKCFVMLHSPLHACARRAEEPKRRRPHAASNERPCSCREFAVCIDCLLRWYWESSQALTKTFAQCPLCRAEFQLEDIVPIYDARATSESGSSVHEQAAEDAYTPEQQFDLSESQVMHQDDAAAPQAAQSDASAELQPEPVALFIARLINSALGGAHYSEEAVQTLLNQEQISNEDQNYWTFHIELEDPDAAAPEQPAEQHDVAAHVNGDNAEEDEQSVSSALSHSADSSLS